MARAALGISTLLDPEEAAEQACQRALERLGASQLAVALVVGSAAYGGSLSRVAAHSSRLLGAGCVVGGSVEGIVASGVEVSSYPAVMVLAVSEVEAEPFLVRDLGGDAERAGEEVAARVGPDLAPDDLVVAIADLLGLGVSGLVPGLTRHLGPATILGTGASPTPRGSSLLWQGSEVARDGIAGFVLRGVRPRVAIAQAGRPVTPPLRVTRARGNWVLALEGRPALDVYFEAVRKVGLEPAVDEPPPLLAGLSESSGSQAVLLRNLVGLDPARAAFSVPEPMASGRLLAFFQLDAAAALQGFLEQLESLRDPMPAFGLYFNCRARGASLFGKAGVEATCLADAFGDRPVAGLIGATQLAPLGPGEAPAALTYAGALALIDDLK